MPFNSHAFLLVFLPIAAAAHARMLHRPPLRMGCLILSSLVFYAWAGPAPLLVLLGMIGLTFAAIRAMGVPRGDVRRLGLVLLLGNVAVLGLFKYYDPLVGAFGLAPGTLPLLGSTLPLGLSFYTFNLLGHGLDVYWGRGAPAASLGQLTAYATFFPTVSSGPLMRFEDFRRQLEAPARPSWGEVDTAVFRIALGLAKKLLIADSLGAVVDPLFADAGSLRLAGAWVAVLGQHFRVYLDFSGYTDIAIGAGQLLGVRVPPNFDAPYTARSLTEFWQRWHMSLSGWFRDYLFFPLAVWLRSLDPRRRSAPARTLSLFVTMVLIGLWHAPTAPYLVWGVYQGTVLAVHASLREAGRKPWPAWVGRLATFFGLMAGWAILRSTSLDMARSLFAAMLGGRGVEPGVIPGVGPGLLLALAALLVLTNVPREASALFPRRSWAFAAGTALLLTLGILALGAPTPFLYLQF